MSITKKISLFSSLIILLVAFAAPPLLILQISTTHAQAQPSFFHATLKHVDHGKGLTDRELLQRLLERGRKRKQRFIMGCGGAINTFETATRNADGEYLMNFSIGTPTPFPITAIMDTGSDLTWIQCQPCHPNCFNQSMPIFDPRKSLSYSKIKCSTKRCQTVFAPAPTCSGHYCSYDYVYDDKSTSKGVIATDTFTFDEDLKVPNLLFGCTFKSTGDLFGGSGIFGLSSGKASIVYQMNEPQFSYCLPTYGSDGPGFLKMGGGSNNNNMSTATPLVTNPTKNPLHIISYYISLQGITIGKTRLKKIDNSTFAIKKEDGSGGMIIDSGTAITYLRQTAFDQVENELTRQIIRPKINLSNFGFDLCFDITKTTLKKKKKSIYKLPAFVLHFQNGVDLKLTQSNTYTFFGDSDDPKKRYVCLMMAGTSDSGISILGSYQQQNTLITYDLAQEKLYFLPNCGAGHHA